MFNTVLVSNQKKPFSILCATRKWVAWNLIILSLWLRSVVGYGKLRKIFCIIIAILLLYLEFSRNDNHSNYVLLLLLLLQYTVSNVNHKWFATLTFFIWSKMKMIWKIKPIILISISWDCSRSWNRFHNMNCYHKHVRISLFPSSTHSAVCLFHENCHWKAEKSMFCVGWDF